MKRVRLACDFCEKTQDQVAKLFAGPRDIAICNECVDLCAEIGSGEAKPLTNETPTAHGAAAQEGGAA